MNAKSKRAYDSAYNSLKDGGSAIYRQESLGSRVDGEWIAGAVTDYAITCYEDNPSSKDIEKGLASVTDSKVLVAAKSMPFAIPKIGDQIVFTDKILTVKQLDPAKSLEGIVVLHQLFSSAMA